jgi:hypothetical protein
MGRAANRFKIGLLDVGGEEPAITTSGGTNGGNANSPHSASSAAGGTSDELARHCQARGQAS